MRLMELAKTLAVISVFALFVGGCAQQTPEKNAAALRIADREAIEDVVNRCQSRFRIGRCGSLCKCFRRGWDISARRKGTGIRLR